MEQAVWAEWSSLHGVHPAPVKEIARRLGMAPADVAFIVYPAEAFGAWTGDQTRHRLMARCKSLRSRLYRTARDLGDIHNAAKGA